MKFRLAVQTIIKGKYKHRHNIMCEACDVKSIFKKSKFCLDKEIKKQNGITIRIAFQSIENGKYKHEKNLMCKTIKIKTVQEKLRCELEGEILEREKLLLEYLCRNRKGFTSTQMESFDFSDKGQDISKREYFENETDWRID